MNISELNSLFSESTLRMFNEGGSSLNLFKNENSCPGDVVVVISFTHDLSGQLVLHWTQECALAFASEKNKFFCGIDEPFTEMNQDVIEVLAEFTNESAGAFLTDLSNENILIKISTPTIYVGGHVVYPEFKNAVKTKFSGNEYSIYSSLFLDQVNIDSEIFKH